jgi:hypothetical protein
MIVLVVDNNIRMGKHSVLSGYIGQAYAITDIASIFALEVVVNLKLAGWLG